MYPHYYEHKWYLSLETWLLFWGIDLEGVIYTHLKRIWSKAWNLKVMKISGYNFQNYYFFFPMFTFLYWHSVEKKHWEKNLGVFTWNATLNNLFTAIKCFLHFSPLREPVSLFMFQTNKNIPTLCVYTLTGSFCDN